MRLPAFAALMAGLLLSTASSAESTAKPAQLGLCAACHGEDGRRVQKGTPNLAGQDVDYLKTALMAYRSGARDIAVMRAATGSLSVADIDKLAQWYAQQPARSASAER